MGGLAVVAVRTRQELRAFIGLPFGLYRQDPSWVAPLRGQQRRQLDRDRNPFFLDAEAAYFLVRRDGRPVGRISAHVDHRYNRFHSQAGTPDTTGFFGFFECEQDPVAAAALVDAAAAWLAEHGSTQMLGPMSFTFLDEAGLLVDGDTSPPTMLMAYNPPYYQSLLEGAGCTPIQDLYAWRLDASVQPPADLSLWPGRRRATTASVRPTRAIPIRSSGGSWGSSTPPSHSTGACAPLPRRRPAPPPEPGAGSGTRT